MVLANIYIILRNPFYYGEFEYPVKSGQWYTGKHTPIIDEELFTKVQLTLNANYIPKTESKEFAFTKLIRCGHCGSGISADEKFKKLKDGSVNRHIYYGCTRSKDKNCKCGYINEVELIQQFEKLIDQVNINEIGMKEKIKYEVERIKRFNQSVLNTKQQIEIKDVDIRDYAKFILRDGLIEEKRELLTCFKSKIILKEKKIVLV